MFKRAFWIMALAAVMLLVFPLVQGRIPVMRDYARSYNFFDRFLLHPESRPTQSGSPADTAVATAPAGYDGRGFLASFYRALRERNSQIRIGHYGDSSIEGDLITGAFRDSLQRRFGGSGVGFVPLVNPIAGFRRTLRQSDSGNWYHVYLGKSNDQGLLRGPSGEYCSSWIPPDTLLSAGDSVVVSTDTLGEAKKSGDERWAFFGTTHLFQGTASLPGARLFYTRPQADSNDVTPAPGTVYLSGGKGSHLPLDGEAELNELTLSRLPLKQLYLSFDLPPSQAVFGLSFESPDGIIVDNFPSRGNTGVALTSINTSMLAGFDRMAGYDLIMLQFGLNALNAKMTDYSWYTREMIRIIGHFREAMPGVAILVIGPSDRAIKAGDHMETDPSVARITGALRLAAEQSQVAFFSFYEAMGGPGSMVEWVEKRQPRLANLDYTHFNFDGADLAAQLLLKFLLEGYETYLTEGAQ